MGFTQISRKTGLKALDALGDNMEDIIDKTLENATSAMVADAVRIVHVITGNLQSSIDNEKVDEGHYQVKAMAPYAGYEEKGTRHREGHPYLEPSVLNHLDDVESLMKGKLLRVAETNSE